MLIFLLHVVILLFVSCCIFSLKVLQVFKICMAIVALFVAVVNGQVQTQTPGQPLSAQQAQQAQQAQPIMQVPASGQAATGAAFTSQAPPNGSTPNHSPAIISPSVTNLILMKAILLTLYKLII